MNAIKFFIQSISSLNKCSDDSHRWQRLQNDIFEAINAYKAIHRYSGFDTKFAQNIESNPLFVALLNGQNIVRISKYYALALVPSKP